jgi:hypothetical protein
VGHRLRAAAVACAGGRRSAGKAHAVPQGRARVRRHPGGVSPVDRRARWSPMAGQERGALRPAPRLARVRCGVTICGRAPAGHGTVHAAHGPHPRLPVGALLRAIPRGHAARNVRRLGQRVRPPDTPCRRLTVDVAALHANPGDGPYGPGRDARPGSPGVAASEPAPHRIVVAGVRRKRRAHEPCGVVVGQTRCHAGQRPAATARIPHAAPHDRARVHLHRRGHGVMDPPDAAQLVGLGLDHRQLGDGVALDGGRSVRPGARPRGTWVACSVLMASIRPW